MDWTCRDCSDFECARRLYFSSIAQASESDIIRWMEAHELFPQAVWCGKEKYHPKNEEVLCVREENHWFCPSREYVECRARYHAHLPFFGGHQRRGIKETLQMIYGFTVGVNASLSPERASACASNGDSI